MGNIIVKTTTHYLYVDLKQISKLDIAVQALTKLAEQFKKKPNDSEVTVCFPQAELKYGRVYQQVRSLIE